MISKVKATTVLYIKRVKRPHSSGRVGIVCVFINVYIYIVDLSLQPKFSRTRINSNVISESSAAAPLVLPEALLHAANDSAQQITHAITGSQSTV